MNINKKNLRFYVSTSISPQRHDLILSHEEQDVDVRYGLKELCRSELVHVLSKRVEVLQTGLQHPVLHGEVILVPLEHGESRHRCDGGTDWHVNQEILHGKRSADLSNLIPIFIFLLRNLKVF